MNMKILWDTEAWGDYLWYQAHDKAALRRVNRLIKSILRDGVAAGEGKPEPLRGRRPWWSRRVNEKNRLVYAVEDGCLKIAQCKGHYNDH